MASIDLEQCDGRVARESLAAASLEAIPKWLRIVAQESRCGMAHFGVYPSRLGLRKWFL